MYATYSPSGHDDGTENITVCSVSAGGVAIVTASISGITARAPLA
jgi:hypothetical protein